MQNTCHRSEIAISSSMSICSCIPPSIPESMIMSRSRSVTLFWPSGSSGLGQFRFSVTTDSTAQLFENNLTGTFERGGKRLYVVTPPPGSG